MLAKMWKKVLLAVCIVACIFNIMSKLVNRTSLEDSLNDANDGNVVFDIFTKKEENAEQEPVNEIVDNKVENEESKTETPEIVTNPEEKEEETEKDKSSGGVKFTDFIIEF